MNLFKVTLNRPIGLLVIDCCETINRSQVVFISFYDCLKKNSYLCIKKSFFPYFPYIMVCILTWSSSKRHRMLD